MDHDQPRPIPLRILATGEYIPSLRVDSNEFDRRWSKPDGWTLRSRDGSRTAHVEHTVAITEDGPVVMTARG